MKNCCCHGCSQRIELSCNCTVHGTLWSLWSLCSVRMAKTESSRWWIWKMTNHWGRCSPWQSRDIKNDKGWSRVWWGEKSDWTLVTGQIWAALLFLILRREEMESLYVSSELGQRWFNAKSCHLFRNLLPQLTKHNLWISLDISGPFFKRSFLTRGFNVAQRNPWLW